MFTGIVEQTGQISVSREVPSGRRIGIEAGAMPADCKHGESVCVSGVCLTVAEVNGQTFEFDVIRETLEKSTLGSKRVGDRVNLERSLRVGDRFDGHFVQGHVDGTALVRSVTTDGSERRLRIEPSSELAAFIVDKGSIAVDGVSLTVAAAGDTWFEVALIPTTLNLTNLAALREGGQVNIEVDYVAKIVVSWMRKTHQV